MPKFRAWHFENLSVIGNIYANVWRLAEVPHSRNFGFERIEPMVGTIDLRMVTDYRAQIDWVICGGESGKNARPMHPYWVRSLRDQCADAGVPFLFKQLGEWREPLGGEEFDTSRGRAQKVPAFIVSKNGSVRCFENDDKAFTTYKARNGRNCGIEDDSGEMCYIVPHEPIVAAINAMKGCE